MKLDFCADDIKFSDFNPQTMVIEVEQRECYEPFIKAVKLAFPKMTKRWKADARLYDSKYRWHCLDNLTLDEMAQGPRGVFSNYEVIRVRDLVYIPLFDESNMDIKSLFEI